MDEETDTTSDLNFAAPSDVACDACRGRKRKAEQSCLQCFASYCENHLEIHNALHANAKRHKLTPATANLKECICPEHDKPMEVFCRTDQQCICYLCITNKHRNHDIVATEFEVSELKIKIGTTRAEITDRIKTRQREIQELKEAIKDLKISARQAVETNEKGFTELIHSIDMRQCEVKEKILAQEEAAVKKAEEVLERLPSEISDLKRRDFELQRLERLSHADNGVHFLQGIVSTPALSSSSSSPVLFIHPYSSFGLATEAVSDLVKHMSSVCDLHSAKIQEHAQTAEILASPILKTRDSLLQNSSKLTFNLNTAHQSLYLSKENKEVTTVCSAQDYIKHPDRFDDRAQILCKEALQGSPQYWEVAYEGNNWVCIAVSYIGIHRKGKHGCLFGRNRYSWSLRCYPASYEFWHNNKHVSVNHNKHCSKIGVYLNHGKGILEFYNVSDHMSLIYKAQTKFTEPVYVGFGLAGKGTYIRICDLEQEAIHEGKKGFLRVVDQRVLEGVDGDTAAAST